MVRSSTSLRNQGAGPGWWQSSPPQLLLLYLSHPMAHKFPSSCESSRATFWGNVHRRSFIWSAIEAQFGHSALQPGIKDTVLRGKSGDYWAVGVSHLKSESLHCWVQKGMSPPQLCEYCTLHEFIFTLLSCSLEMFQIGVKYFIQPEKKPYFFHIASTVFLQIGLVIHADLIKINKYY